MNKNGNAPVATGKKIVLEPNKPPAIIGPWSVGEVRHMAAILTAWLDSIPLSTVAEDEPEKAAEQA